jgi:chromosome segregation ATPase
MSKETPLTKEFFLEVMQGVNGQFKSIDGQFKSINSQFARIDARLERIDVRFESIDGQLQKIHERLREHDDLLEMIAGEVSGTQNLLNELAPARKDHETRITRLERGFTKLILKS